jgi:hypothetical protein
MADLETLKTYQIQAALMEASGKFTTAQIAEQIGMSTMTIYKWRAQPEYKEALMEYKAAFERRWLAEMGTDYTGMLNKFIPEALYTQVQLMRKGEPDSTKLAATRDILDRAPDAPRASRGGAAGESGKVIIQIGVQARGTIKEAFADIGDGEALELMEGIDFNDAEGGKESGKV